MNLASKHKRVWSFFSMHTGMRVRVGWQHLSEYRLKLLHSHILKFLWAVSNTRSSWKSAYIVSVLLLYLGMQHQQWVYYNKKLTVSDRSIPWVRTFLTVVHHANYTTADVRLRDQGSSLLKVSGSYIFCWNWWYLDFYLWLAGLLLSFCVVQLPSV